MAICFNQSDKPQSYSQFFLSMKKALPGGPFIHLAYLWFVGLFGMLETELVLIKNQLSTLVTFFT
jgi:hypothetical protein